MTRDQVYNFLHCSAISDEQIKSIIEALTCEDAISREDARSVICMAFSKVVSSNPSREVREILNLCKENLEQLPPVIPSRRKGRWLYKEITDDYRVKGQCSECKQRKIIDYFCPNCGAEMGSEE